MARLLAAMAMLMLVVLSIMTPGIVASQEAALRAAITSLTTKSFTLTEDLTLTSNPPTLPPNKVFTLKGAKLPRGRQVKINGAGKYNLFNNTDGDEVTLSLENLFITNTKDAAVKLFTLGTKLTVTDVTFSKLPRALELDLVTATITRSKFESASNIAVYVSSQESEPDVVTVRNSQFLNNRGPGESTGGAAIFGIMYASINVDSSKFIGNRADYVGGAFRLRQAYATIRRSEFTNNFVRGDGGAVSVYCGGLTISGTTFKGNRAGVNGGAIRVASDGDVGGFASVANSVFENNQAKGSGGVFVLDKLSEIIFCRSRFSRNTDKSGVGNGFSIGTGNFVTTTPFVVIPVTGDPVDFKNGTKCG